MSCSRILSCAGVALLASATAARADGYLILNAGITVPIGDDDWKDLVDTSPSVGISGGSTRKVSAHSRLGIEAAFSYAPLSENVSTSAIRLDLTQYRALIGVRLEQLVAHGTLLALHGGIGIDHLRAELSSPLLPGAGDSDTDTGIALDLGGGVWFSAGPVLLGVELSLPMGFHRDDNQNNPDAAIDFQDIDLSVLGGVRFHL